MVLVTRIVITYYGKEQDFLVSKNKDIFGVFPNAYDVLDIVNNEYKLDHNNKRLYDYNVHFNVSAKNGGCVEWTTKNIYFESETKKIFIIKELSEEISNTIYKVFESERKEKD